MLRARVTVRSLAVAASLVAVVGASCAGGDDSAGSALPPAGATVEPCPGGFSPTVLSVDIASGGLRWSWCPPEPAVVELLAATDDMVYSTSVKPGGTGRAEVVAIGADDGAERWRTTVASTEIHYVPGPFAGDDVVVLTLDESSGPELVGMDAGTGEARWRRPGLVPIANTDEVVLAAPGVDATGSVDLRLLGLERASGDELWVVDTIANSGAGISSGVDGSTAVLERADETRSLDALSADSGEQRWSIPYAEAVVGAAGVVLAGTESESATVRAHDTETGAELWSRAGRRFNSLWAVDDEAVYLHHGDEAVAYDLRSGATRWRIPWPGMLYGAGEGVVFVNRDEVALVGLSAEDGQELWSLPIPRIDDSYPTNTRSNGRDVFVGISDAAPTD